MGGERWCVKDRDSTASPGPEGKQQKSQKKENEINERRFSTYKKYILQFSYILHY